MTRDDEPERDILKVIVAYRRPTITAGELHQALPKEQRYEWQEEVLAKIGNMWREGLSDANRQEPTRRSQEPTMRRVALQFRWFNIRNGRGDLMSRAYAHRQNDGIAPQTT